MAVMFSKIGIIGGGISGLAAAKQLAQYNPVVLEATDSIGGVWKHCSFRTTKLQTPRCDYEFSDFPWPLRDNSSFPSYIEILDYLNSYATHFDLFKFIKFNSRVTEIRLATNIIDHDHNPNNNNNNNNNINININININNNLVSAGKPVWEVAVQTTNGSSDHIQWYGFEFIVVCMGKYGDVPIIPKYGVNKGPEVFKGKVMHSQEYSDLTPQDSSTLLKGKKVVVVGYKKSAIDLAVECAQANQGEDGKSCTMVVRTLHWIVPHYSIWGLPFYLFYSTRFSQFLHQRPNQGTFRNLLCHLLSPARKATSKMIESYLLWKLPLAKYGLKPDHPFEEDYASCQMAILPETFFQEADKGMINFKRASDWWFWEGGVEFEDKTKLEADLVILATGYDGKKKLKASVSNLHTSEIRCKWLARLIGGKFKLPSMEKMVDQINTETQIMKKTTRFYKRTCISTFSINHTDEICQEMGWSSWRKNNWFAEAFSPYNSRDYEDEEI
ncbi:hypothetical protein E3N88_43389 [Mikania micrantha]|uniref:Flavin-containing monooxygenase n=1 Tax=Mikania micrantha TaxID=192012 RepID=A0A5N6LHB2_9ASTR|nr:hypothetical protein E3N88_43389 [Mikania micrantha]